MSLSSSCAVVNIAKQYNTEDLVTFWIHRQEGPKESYNLPVIESPMHCPCSCFFVNLLLCVEARRRTLVFTYKHLM